MRWPRAIGRRCSKRSTGSSRPGTIRAGSPAICCNGCAISRCCRPCRRPSSAGWWRRPTTRSPAWSSSRASSARPPSPATARSCTSGSPRCAVPPRPGCCWSCSAPACCCPPPPPRSPACWSASSGWSAGRPSLQAPLRRGRRVPTAT